MEASLKYSVITGIIFNRAEKNKLVEEFGKWEKNWTFKPAGKNKFLGKIQLFVLLIAYLHTL